MMINEFQGQEYSDLCRETGANSTIEAAASLLPRDMRAQATAFSVMFQGEFASHPPILPLTATTSALLYCRAICFVISVPGPRAHLFPQLALRLNSPVVARSDCLRCSSLSSRPLRIVSALQAPAARRSAATTSWTHSRSRAVPSGTGLRARRRRSRCSRSASTSAWAS